MITVRLKGGLGNQMFQYAFAYSLARQLGTDFQMDLSVLLDRSKPDIVPRNYDLDIFTLVPKFRQSPALLKTLYYFPSSRMTKVMKRSAEGGQKYIKEEHFHVMQSVLRQPMDKALYDGWWQSEAYFADVAKEIRQEFTFRNKIEGPTLSLLTKIQNCNSVCLNIRRTDFLNNPTLNTTSLAYFERAAQYMIGALDTPSFFVFSDDIEWCLENIKLAAPTTFVTHDHKGHKFGNYLQMMAACHHFIIPNSSFAWWAVWLNDAPNKVVVAPQKWLNGDFNTNDLVPEHWVRL